MRLVGASMDDVRSLGAFAEAQELPFPLLSDPDGSLAAKYASLMGNGRMAARVTFVIDPQGVIRHVDRKVDVTSHGADLLRVVADLQGKQGD